MGAIGSTCLAHRIRTARSLAERQLPELAACGTWALAELRDFYIWLQPHPLGESCLLCLFN